MISTRASLRQIVLAGFIVLSLLAFAGPASAAVTTVYNCPPGEFNQDYLFNGFYVSGLSAVNIHTVTIYYTTDTTGSYNLSLTAMQTDGAAIYSGTQVGSTQTQAVTLTTKVYTPVIWSFGDAPFTSGKTLAFIHGTPSGPGSVLFNMQPTICPGDLEGAGNDFSVAVKITENAPAAASACVANSTTLCIDDQPGDKRFQVRASYATTQAGGRSGNGEAVALHAVDVTEGGIFWFFSATNPEMLIKVLNGCGTNDHFWVFFAAMTNVGFTVTVEDTKTHALQTYNNPDLTAALPVQDTAAFPCP